MLGSSAHVGTFGWDRIVMSFDMNDHSEMNEDDASPCTTLTFSYTWLVMNNWVRFSVMSSNLSNNQYSV